MLRGVSHNCSELHSVCAEGEAPRLVLSLLQHLISRPPPPPDADSSASFVAGLAGKSSNFILSLSINFFTITWFSLFYYLGIIVFVAT